MAPLTLRQQIEVAMDASMLPPNVEILPSASDVKKTLLAAVKTEMAVLESTGTRGRLLQQIYDWLLSIPQHRWKQNVHSLQLVCCARRSAVVWRTTRWTRFAFSAVTMLRQSRSRTGIVKQRPRRPVPVPVVQSAVLHAASSVLY